MYQLDEENYKALYAMRFQRKVLPDSGDIAGVKIVAYAIHYTFWDNVTNLGPLMTWLDKQLDDDDEDLWVLEDSLGSICIDPNFVRWRCTRCKSTFDPNRRSSIVNHLRDSHRRGPEGLLPKPPSQRRQIRAVLPATTPTTKTEINPATPDSTKPPPYDAKNTQTDALIKENQLLKAENAKLKTRLAYITRVVNSESEGPVV